MRSLVCTNRKPIVAASGGIGIGFLSRVALLIAGLIIGRIPEFSHLNLKSI